MREEKVESLIKHHQMQCNRYVNGHCSTRACYTRGGYSGKGPVGNVEATCVDHEWVVMLADHDAALRRAKAEVLDDAAKAICMYCNDPEWQKRDEDDNHESPYTRTMYPCAAYKIHDLIRELDARAAQIEEGE